MAEGYIHVLRDHGQDICDDCKLQGDEDIEGWENFLNGEWTQDPVKFPGMYPVVLKRGGKVAFHMLSTKGMETDKDIKLRWSVPIPHPPQKKEV
jgi:hypothetical protein